MAEKIELHSADATQVALEIAGLGSRSYAFVIDWHIRALFALTWMLGAALAMSSGDLFHFVARTADTEPTTLIYVVLAPAAVVYFFYHPVLEILMRGRTPGKRIAGVRLVDMAGQSPEVGAILIRNLFRLVDSLPGFYAFGCLACLLTRHSVRIGDLAAGTLLIYESKIPSGAFEQILRVASAGQDGRLASADQELLLELLQRWKFLDRAVRVRLARAFLQRLQEPLPEETEIKALDQALYGELLRLYGGAPP
jgi:uncharacterized RDD family membrane protein YckC